MGKAVDHMKQTRLQGLQLVAIDMSTVRVVALSDASFANASGMRSQIELAVLMSDGKQNASIVHYGPKRSPRVSRSTMAVEVQAVVHTYDNLHDTRAMFVEWLRPPVEIEAYLDYHTVFYAVAKNSNIAERRLQNELFALKGSYRGGELKEIGGIPGKNNAADVRTKEILTHHTAMWK